MEHALQGAVDVRGGVRRGLRCARMVFALFGVLVTPVVGAVCTVSGASAEPMPAFEHLRAWHAGLRAPARLALDTADNLYASDPPRGAVVVRAPDGRVLREGLGLGQPLGIAVAADGSVLVGDGSSGAVTAYDADWKPRFVLGVGAGEFSLPGDIAVDPVSGRIYVVDGQRHEVAIYDADGAPLARFGGRGAGDGQFDFPAGIAVDPQAGEVLVSDQRNSRMQFFDGDGNFIACVQMRTATRCGFDFACGTGRQYDQGLTLDTLGRIYVADSFEGVVQVLARDGNRIGAIGGHGTGPGKLRSPMDVVIDSFGRLMVSSPANGRLEMYALSPALGDPERYVPATVSLAPNPVPRESHDGELVALVEVPGYRLGDVSGLTANGVAPISIESGDADRDAEPDLSARFDLEAVTGPLRGGVDVPVLVSASLGPLELRGEALLQVSSILPPDGDGDGVLDDADQCPNTAADALVDTQGCAVAQACTCDGDSLGKGDSKADRNKHHRRPDYRRCVVGFFKDLRPRGPHTHAERKQWREQRREALRADCGRKRR